MVLAWPKWTHDLLADLHLGLRSWLRTPAFAGVAIVTIALGIGANTAFFSLLDSLLLRPLPVEDASRLIRIGSLARNGINSAVPGPLLDRLRENSQLAGVCGIETPLSSITLNSDTFPAGTLALSGDCYATLVS